MKRGARKENSKWGATLDIASVLVIGHSFIFEGDARAANQLRSILNTSNRTQLFRFTVKQDGPGRYLVTKVGEWKIRIR